MHSNNVVIDSGWFDNFFLAYCKDQQQRDLDLMIACIYRPVNVFKWVSPWLNHADKRIKFNSESVEKRADKFKSLPDFVKKAILFQSIGIRDYQIKMFPRVYSGEQHGVSFGFLGLMLDLAGPKFGTIKEVEQVNMQQILTFIEKSNHETNQQTYNLPT